jgi:RND family efflux transporter MFP subunit
MRKGLIITLFLSAMAALMAACASTSTGNKSSNPGDKAQVEAKKPPVAVDVTSIATADLAAGIEVIGTLTAKYQAEVKSEYAGIAKEVLVTEWVPVTKGQPLVQLDSREPDLIVKRAEAALRTTKAVQLQAEVAAARAKREFERVRNMRAAGLATQQNLDEAASAKDAAEAQVQAGQSQIALAEEDLRYAQTRRSKVMITAPMDGIIAYRGVNVGDLVGEMGSPKIMFLIVEIRILDLVVKVPSTEIAVLRVGQPLEFTTESFPNRTFTGKVMYINPTLDPSDRSVKVQAEVRNDPPLLKSGMFVRGRILAGQRIRSLQVPRQALLDWDMQAGKASVFLVSGNKAQRHEVRTGAVNGDQVQITVGLNAGDQVVIRG